MENLVTIKSIQHVGIPVTDIHLSKVFYNRLGFVDVMESPFTNEDGTGICVMMKNKEIVIELYQLPAKQLKEIAMRKNGHVDHIAFDVDDIDLVFNILKHNSFTILEAQPVYLPFWKNGCRYFNVLGPDGEILEFNQIL